MAQQPPESQRFLQFVQEYDQRPRNDSTSVRFFIREEPINPKLRLLMHLRHFHYYRCIYERQKFGETYIPTLKELWSVCQYHSEESICDMAPTDAWRQIHCVYGRKFRNYLCHCKRINPPLIVTKKELDQYSGQNVKLDYPKPAKVLLSEFIVNMLYQPYRRRAIQWSDSDNLLFECNGMKLGKLWSKIKGNSADAPNGANLFRVMQESGNFIHPHKGSSVYQFEPETLELLRFPCSDFPPIFEAGGFYYSILNGPYFPNTERVN